MKELDNSTSTDRLVEILETLNSDFKPTEALLRETKLGVAVNKLRTHSDSRVSTLVKSMISRWKDQVTAQKQAQARMKAKAAAAASPAGAKSATSSASPASAVKSETPGAKFNADKPRNAKNDGISTNVYADKVRNSCVDVIYTALAVDSIEQPKAILEAAKRVEGAVYAFEKGATPTYRTKMRSLFMNLKDPKNPGLRTRVVSGDISAERLRTMSPQEMAPEELKKEIEQIEKQNLFNAQGAKEQRAVTDRFTCGKCKQKKVSYYQMQTRSADEPLTTFCTCENCGNRWKFS